MNYFGNGWDCERGYYRANGNCTEVQVPEQATLNYYGNGWKCMRGYRRSISACVPVGVPEAGDAELESAR